MAGRTMSRRPIRTMIRAVFSTLLLLMVDSCLCLECLSQSGKPVDWFIIYKLPRYTLQDDSFFYMDADKPSWQLSPTTLNATTGHAVYYTLEQIYSTASKDKVDRRDADILKWRSSRFILNGKYKPGLQASSDILYAMYNDEEPIKPTQSSRRSGYEYQTTGHTKGIIGFDARTGFWLIQSTPKFPNKRADGYGWPHNGNYYAQSFLCISMATDPYLNEIGKQFEYNYPKIYDSATSTFSSMYPNITRALNKTHVKSPPWNRKTKLTSLAGKNFYSYAKSSNFNADLYSTWVAPDLQDDLYDETWQNGRNKLCSNCTGKYKVFNVETLAFKEKSVHFKETEDHAKWAVTMTNVNGAWTCIGDINRQESQMKRGGGTVCTDDSNIWSAFHSLISSYHDCKPYKKCVEV